MTTAMHVISHTHWDREWYRAFQTFRVRLVDVIDAALDLLTDMPDYRYFHLDGQTIVLEDYLEIRPEREAQIRQFVTQGRLLLGPWYTQPDEFLVSGEAMVRNLMLGMRMARQYGGCMNIGYLPDSFGHASQMPQICAGFGFSAALIFRGITADHVRSAFRWGSPDGSQVLTIKMPDDDAYSNYLYRLRTTLSAAGPIDNELLNGELSRLRADYEATAVCKVQLWMDGVDHIFPNPKTPEIITIANQLFTDATITHSTLPAYVKALQDAKPELAHVHGELRHANRAWKLQAVLANVASSHIEVKLANFAAQQALERIVEPLCTFSWLQGNAYPHGFLAVAWKHLLQNHAHDSICGCSIDQVHRDMHYRFDQTRIIADVMRERALRQLAERADTRMVAEDEKGVVIYNPLPWERTGAQIIEVVLPVDTTPELHVCTADGSPVPHQLLGMQTSAPLRQPKYDIPTPTPSVIARLALHAPMQPYALNLFRIKSAPMPQRSAGTLFTSADTFENDALAVTTGADGTVAIRNKATGKIYRGLLAIEDRGDGGEGWNWIPPHHDVTFLSLGSPVTISRVHDGPLIAAVRISVRFMIPEGFNGAAHEHDPAQMQRSEKLVEMPVEFTLTLGAGWEHLDIAVTVANNSRNHRVRLLFPTDLVTEHCYADSAFDVVQRAIPQEPSADWREPQLGTYPMHSFVAVQDNSEGLAVIATGVHEYEVMDEPRRTIAVTLMRAFGRGPGGPQDYLDSQEIGAHHYKLAVMPYQGNWEQAGVLKASRLFAALCITADVAAHDGELPVNVPMLEVDSNLVDVTAVKRCEERDSALVRMVSLADDDQTVTVRLAAPVQAAYLTDLNEERVSDVAVEHGNSVRLSIPARRIVTLELVR